MSAGSVLAVLKVIGEWAAKNPMLILDVTDKVAKLKPNDKIDQLGTAVLGIDQKIDSEVEALRSDISVLHNELKTLRNQVRTMKSILSIMGAILIVAVIAIVMLAIF